MTALVAAFALASQDATVTFAHRAAPTPIVVKALGESLGQTLTADPELTDTDLYLNVTDLPVETLFKKVAEATGGVWLPTPKGRHLDFRPKPERQDAETKAAARQSFDKTFPPLTDKPYSVAEAKAEVEDALRTVRTAREGDYEAISRHYQREPQGRLVNRIVRALGADQVLSVAFGQRVVWSTEPTPTQRRLPAEASAALAVYNAEVANHTTALEEANVSDDDRQSYYLPILHRTQGIQARGLMVAVKSDVYNVEVTVRALGSDGFVSSSQSFSPFNAEPKPAGELPFDVPSEPIALSPLAQALVGTMQRTSKAPDPEVTAAVRKEMETLETSELPGVLLSDLLDQTAKATGLDIVSAAPFTVGLFAGGMVGTQEGDLKKAWQTALGGFQFLAVKVEDGVATVGATPMVNAYVLAMSRKTGALMARAASDGDLTLDELAGIAVASKSQTDASGAGMVLQFGYTDLANQVSQAVSSYATLRMYGLLDQNQRRQARAGGVAFQVSGLPPRLAQEYRRLVFVDEPRLTLPTGDHQRPPDADEPTIGLPSGLPANGQILIEVKSLKGLLSFTEYGPGFSYTQKTTPEQIASTIAWGEIDGQNRYPVVYAQAGYETLTVSGAFPGPVSHEASLTVLPNVPLADRVGLEKLPKELREEIESDLAEARKNYAEYRGRRRPQGRIRP